MKKNRNKKRENIRTKEKKQIMNFIEVNVKMKIKKEI